MRTTIGRLTALSVARQKDKGLYADGGGLYLQVSASGTKSWIYRFMLRGKTRDMGLGSYRDVSLAEARNKAAEFRKMRNEGVDPVEASNSRTQYEKLEAARAMSFEQCATACIEARRPSWRNAKHAAQWESTLAKYAYPIFGNTSVQSVDTALVMKVLEPIWSTKTETASRVRGRIECVLDWAAARGYRRGENPARWLGHLENLLPNRGKVRRVQHHPALPYHEIGVFMAALRTQKSIAAFALRFLILTGTRTSETVGARWEEVDLANAVWTIPANRIKAGKEHRVPLSEPALANLEEMKKPGQVGFVFPGGKKAKPLSNMALLALLKRMGRADLTAHGFRSTFRDWAAECTNFSSDVAEMALAHAVSNKVEAAYRRGDLFEKRRRLMREWARYCESANAPSTISAIKQPVAA